MGKGTKAGLAALLLLLIAAAAGLFWASYWRAPALPDDPATKAQQAADALKEVATTQKRSAQAYSYSLAAPYCFVWGAVWLLGYGAEALASFGYSVGIWTGWWWTNWACGWRRCAGWPMR